MRDVNVVLTWMLAPAVFLIPEPNWFQLAYEQVFKSNFMPALPGC